MPVQRIAYIQGFMVRHSSSRKYILNAIKPGHYNNLDQTILVTRFK